jgi:phosphoglycolate phosphatase
MKPINNMPEAVIFDWDDTLADNWKSIHFALNATLTEMKQPIWSMKKTKTNVRRSLRDSFPEMFGAKWREAADMFYEHIRFTHLETLEPIYFAKELLDQLKQSKILLGIVSNKTGDLLRAECEHLGWSDYFINIVGANDSRKDKPAADPLFLCLEGSGVKPSQNTWYVGDAPTDIECAVNSGVTGVLIRNSEISEDYDEFPPQLHFNDLYKMAKSLQ